MLPIEEVMSAVKAKLREGNTLIVEAPPGAGKSTVLPLRLLEEEWLGNSKILLLEPRRLAAKAVAGRMAQLLGESVGDRIGYRIRFEHKTSSKTRILVVTEGVLSRMLQDDNALEEYGMVIFDEFHERSLQADLGLALTRQVQEVLREDLRLLIMSATLDTAGLAKLLEAPVVSSEGRQYPVGLTYLGRNDRMHLSVRIRLAAGQALREQEGDLLVFLPGTGDIRRVAEALSELEPEIAVHPLYGDLRPQEQQRALMPDPSGRRKIVLATSIAETSLTIQGIGAVIDSGLARAPRFDPRSGMTRLETIPVTRDAADQRAGRAGRLGPGWCYRLWDEAGHHHLASQRSPEILQADLAPLLLELAAWGIAPEQVEQELTWATPPPMGAVEAGKDLLRDLRALEKGRITRAGKALLRYPTHPRMAHLLEVGRETNAGPLAADLVALLEERDPLGRETGADLRLRLDALRRFRQGGRKNGRLARIDKLARQYCRLMRVQTRTRDGGPDEAGRLVAAAYPERVAQRVSPEGERYRLAQGRSAGLESHDGLAQAPWLAIAHLDAGLKGGRIFLAAPFNPEDLIDQWEEQTEVRWDPEVGLLAQREWRLGGLLVQSKPLKEIPESERHAALCKAVKEDPELLNWTDDVERFRARAMSLRIWRTKEEWPDLNKEKLCQDPAPWLAPYLNQVKKKDDFRRLDLLAVLKGLLPWNLANQIDQLAPEHFEVPSGSRVRIKYSIEGKPPVLAARLQEMFGLLETPRLNESRTPMMIHLLSPAMRPVQVTQDLKNFWENTYAEVRKELRGRYSKHHWPENPLTAEATRWTKRRKPPGK